MKVLVAGASGFVGRRLTAALVEAGHQVRAMTRHPERYEGPGTPVGADVHDPETLAAAVEGCEAAYYLVHSLDAEDFETRDADAARAFGQAAAAAGLGRIVYLGGLGDDSDQLSAHLRSRREVERLLGEAGVPTTTLRAGIIIGRGGISWELTRQLVEHLPAMVTPTWVTTRTQPIAIADVVRYLVGVLDLPEAAGRALEIGGPEVLQYRTMLQRVAKIQGRSLPIVAVPLLTPRLSSLWLSLVTNVDTTTGRALVDSMTNEVVVKDDAIRRLVPFEPLSYDEAVRQALDEREEHGDSDGPWSGALDRILGALPRAITRQNPTVPEEREGVRDRRRQVVAGFGVVAAGLLGVSLSTEPGATRFPWLTGALAATWIGGALISGPLHLGSIQGPRGDRARPVRVSILASS